MSAHKIILGVAILVAISTLACIMVDTPTNNLKVGKEPETVPYVDVSKYIGVWYEQAVIPYYFERGCSKTTATYSINPDGKSLRVDNKCYRDGKAVESVGKAIPEDSTNSKLKVEFVVTLDIGAQYWIVRLAKDYSYTVITSPNYHYLWVLYREPVMPEELYRSILADIQKDGYPVEKLVRTQQ